MSERTTIGGTVYETVGSSSSNLLLRCNGTARIQWGNKLIDLIKNGKIVSGEGNDKVSIISDESEIKSDGIYVLSTDESLQFWISKNGTHYNLTGTDLYISASNKQDITVEQKQQALENIGMYYNTLVDVKSAGIQNGLVYVLEDNKLYTVKEGIVAEFEAKLQTVTVKEENEEGEVINSSFQIVLSILDDEYLVLKDRRITANYDVHVKTSAQLGSENADEYTGYRLYFDKGKSCLDVDKINVRDGLPNQDYVEVTFEELQLLISTNRLIPHEWYLITDYQNPWKLPKNSFIHNRPILIKALTSSTFYSEGQLFKDQRVIIKYDPSYMENVQILSDSEGTVTARGRITWMKDSQGNEANFDFLDYYDYEGNPLTTLHQSAESDELDASVFPKGSYNNKITIHDLKGTIIKDGLIVDDTYCTELDFKLNDDSETETSTPLEMHDNEIECRGLILSETCKNFSGNTLKEICKVQIDSEEFINNDLTLVYTTFTKLPIDSFDSITDNTTFDITYFRNRVKNVTMKGFVNSAINADIVYSTFDVIDSTKINNKISNSSFNNITNCTLDAEFNNVKFLDLTSCNFASGNLEDITCHSKIEEYNFSKTNEDGTDKDVLLYDITKIKDVYYDATTKELQVIVGQESTFLRGMIVMHSGLGGIPEGWALCDGQEYTYNGVTSITPDLRNKFIRASVDAEHYGPSENLDVNENNELTLRKEHLPEHSHPHKPHTHTMTDSTVVIENSGDLSLSGNQLTNTAGKSENSTTVLAAGEGVTEGTAEVLAGIEVSNTEGTAAITLTGGNHTHTGTITNGTITESTSEEDIQTWENTSIKIEPNYYALIFIMKL